MNFRIDLPNQEVRDLISQRNFKRLQSYDQLLNNKDGNVILSKYNEGELNFLPTYKFDKNCDVYDTSSKIRIPAWCDRVLMSRDQQYKQQLLHDTAQGDDQKASLPIYYNSKHSDNVSGLSNQAVYLSDHRPILAIYKLPIIKIDKDKKEKLRNEILSSLLGSDGKISKETLKEKTRNIKTEDYTQIIDHNYLTEQQHKIMIKNEFELHRQESVSQDLLGMED